MSTLELKFRSDKFSDISEISLKRINYDIKSVFTKQKCDIFKSTVWQKQ